VKAAASPQTLPGKAAGASAAEPCFFEPPSGLTRDGFFLVGTVVGRVRREFPAHDDKPTRYNITLGVQTADGLIRPERWSDTPSPSDVPARGARVVLPVVLSYYHGKGGTGCRLTWGGSAQGEEF
jgi:hypothetical protein